MEVFWYEYILKCSNGLYYVVYSIDVERRVFEHNSGKVHFTQDKRPVVLITYIAFTDKYKAIAFEKYLKSGSGMAFRNRHLI
jgi:putative endonuclease